MEELKADVRNLEAQVMDITHRQDILDLKHETLTKSHEEHKSDTKKMSETLSSIDRKLGKLVFGAYVVAAVIGIIWALSGPAILPVLTHAQPATTTANPYK